MLFSALWALELVDPQGIADFEVALDQDFDPIHARLGKSDVDEHLDAGGRGFRRSELNLNVFSFGEHGVLIGVHNPRALREGSVSTAPPGDEAELSECAGKLFGVNGVKQSDEHEFAVALLTDIVADETGLEIR